MNSKAQILIVNPEPNTLALMGSMLQSLGHTILEAPNDRVAAKRIELEHVDVVVAWTDPEDTDALELLSYLRRKHPALPVILVFSKVNTERCHEAKRLGANAVLRYPLPPTEIRAAVIQALLNRPTPVPSIYASASPLAVMAKPPEPAFLTTSSRPSPSCHIHRPEPTPTPAPAPVPVHEPAPTPRSRMIGEDPGLKLAIEMIPAIASRTTPILIEGERGTGKSLLAQLLHQHGLSARNAFIEVNCATLGDAMLERELFGHRVNLAGDPGAVRPGALALARGGTIYLDDVAALSPGLQVQLLRVLTDHEYQPVGSTQTLKCTVRFILSTREDLSTLVAQGKLRPDLYYRIGVLRLKLPPLRHRGSDIDRLAQHFAAKFAREFDKPILGIAPEALDLLRKHEWPGNVEEIESAVQRGVALCQSSQVSSADLVHCLGQAHRSSIKPGAIPSRTHLPMSIRPLKEALEEPEKQIIVEALQALNWNRQETARVLDINRTTLYKKMKKYGLLIDEPIWVD